MAECAELEPLLTAEQVGSWLQKHPEHIRYMARKGSLPGAMKVGDTWRFDRRRIEQWLRGEDETTEAEKD